MNAGSVAWRGTTLRYWVGGAQGAPWLAVCHGGALDHQSFRGLANALGEHWRILLWDLPGHGESQPMPPGFSVPLCAEALSQVMNAAGVPRAVIMGFSFGGMVAQYFSRAYPAHVAGLIAYSCFVPFLAPAPVPPAVLPTIMLAYRMRSWPALQADFACRCSAVPSVQEDTRRAMQPLGKPGFLQMTRALFSAFMPDASFRIAAPLLIISGSQDSNGVHLRRSLAALRAAHPHAGEFVLAQAGHCAHAEMPERFLHAVLPFLDGCT